MDSAEWLEIVAVMAANWASGRWSEATERLAFDRLKEFDASLVREAAWHFMLESRFPPTPGELVAYIRTVLLEAPAPSFDELWIALQDRLGAVGQYDRLDGGHATPAYAIAAVALTDTVLDVVEQLGGWEWLCRGGSPDGSNPMPPGVLSRKARDCWSAIREREDIYQEHRHSQGPIGEAARAFFERRADRRDRLRRMLPPAMLPEPIS
jgi:hypothetical protein